MNFYQPYQTPYQAQIQQTPVTPYQTPTWSAQYQQLQYISGKYVDSIDVVRATEVPMGGSGVFPKADLSEIYIKTWNADGTTKILIFKPEVTNVSNADTSSVDDELKTLLNVLNEKVDKLTTELGG